MFTKVFSTISILVALSAHVNGHTLMTPALGVQGAGARSDVQVGLLDGGGCGSINVAENIDSSTPVAAAPDGTFTVTATNFNRLRDGSREVTAKMDSTGTGKNFNTAVTVSQNGDPRPKTLGSDQIVAKLPAGTTCSGGASGNLCLVSFQNGAIQRFGNCVVVSQDAAAGSATAAGAATGTTAAGAATGASDTSAVGASTGSTANEVGAGTGASTGTTASTGVGAGVNGAASGAGVATSGSTTASTGQTLSQAGTRAARALLAELESLGDDLLAEDPLDLVRRGIADWIWA